MKQRTPKTRLLCMLLTLAMLIVCMAAFPVSAVEETETETETITATENWEAAKDGVFYIDSAADLLAFGATLPNTTYAGKTIMLTADIDLNPNWKASTKEAPANQWSSYGAAGAFEGTFDGQNHTVSGVYCVDTSKKVGFFRQVQNGGAVKNLKLTNSYFCGGGTYIGSICGSVNPTSGTLENIYSDAIVEGYGTAYIANVGGIVGGLYSDAKSSYTTATLKNVTFAGTVTGAKNVGGIVGYVNCVNSSLTMENCMNQGTVNAELNTDANGYTTSDPGQGAGGMVGCCNGSATLTNCFNSGAVNGYYELGGIIGQTGDGKASNAVVILTDCINCGIITATEYNKYYNNTSPSASTAKNSGGVVGCAKGNTTLTMTRCVNAGKVNAARGYECSLAYLESRFDSAVTGGNFTVKDCYAVAGMAKMILASWHCKYKLTVQYGEGNETKYDGTGSKAQTINHDTLIRTVSSVTDILTYSGSARTAYADWVAYEGNIYPQAVFDMIVENAAFPMTVYGTQTAVAAEDNTVSLRLIGLVNIAEADLENWSKIGFDVCVKDATGTKSKTIESATVYSRITAAGETYTAADFDANYLAALVVEGFSSTGDYTLAVRSFAVDKDNNYTITSPVMISVVNGAVTAPATDAE